MCSLTFDPIDSESVAKHLICPDTLCHRRAELASKIVEAYKIVYCFADSINWQTYMQKLLFTSIQIFESQKELWCRIKKLTGSIEKFPPTDGLSAAICSDHLLTVVPELYKRIRPEYAHINKAWTRLLAHEMIHQLHIRFVGTEEKMGPQWFYEGFAMYGAGQSFGVRIMSISEAIEAIHAESRGAYAKYIAAFEFFLERIELNQMLQHSAETDFESWLVALAGSSEKTTDQSYSLQ